MVLALLFGAVSAASAAERFYIAPLNIEPGETRQVNLILDNAQEYFGFQAEITLPEGLMFVENSGDVDFTLTDRADNSFTKVQKLLSSQSVCIGAFSLKHLPFSGNDGTLVSIQVKASENFSGGTIEIHNIMFVNSLNTDVTFPDFFLEVGNSHINRCFIPDFNIRRGICTFINIELENETAFTAFQMDLYPPKGLVIDEHNITLSPDRVSDHSLSLKSLPDGRVRIICLSLSNALIKGSSGPILKIGVSALKNIAETSELEIKDIFFSTAKAREYILPNSKTTINADGEFGEIPPTSVTISNKTLALMKGETFQLTANVLPIYADNTEVAWSSSNSNIVSVNNDGYIEAINEGTATIRAYCVDYPEIFDECNVTVSFASGINPVSISGDAANAPVEIYDLNGHKVSNSNADLLPGIYVVRQGNKVSKVVVK